VSVVRRRLLCVHQRAPVICSNSYPTVGCAVSHSSPRACDAGVLLWSMFTGVPAWQGLRRTQVLFKVTALKASLQIPPDCPPVLKASSPPPPSLSDKYTLCW